MAPQSALFILKLSEGERSSGADSKLEKGLMK